MPINRTTETARAVVLVTLMLTMSMSSGIVDLNRAPWAAAEPPAALAEDGCEAVGCPSFTSPSVDEDPPAAVAPQSTHRGLFLALRSRRRRLRERRVRAFRTPSGRTR